ncbi:MAG: capsular biosynthesis protein [Syntrophaceae bacterium]|nr:capsular biosynthesis protein [Syntrophaceae bacterium]
MRICIDIDGVICKLRRTGEAYGNLKPVQGAIENIKRLKTAGHCIILYTARHMKTCRGNVGKVIALQAATTLEWLARHGIEYDEIHFGKPYADVYIDDNALRFESWEAIESDDSLPMSSEERHEMEGQ